MKNHFNRWMTIVVLITIFVYIASAGSHSSKVAATTREPVLVTNNSEEPVPVQVFGTAQATINNTATNKVPVVATQSGTWSVNVASVVPIKDINNLAHDPFCTTLSLTPADGATFTVPANKRLVINQFSAYDSGSTVQCYFIFAVTNGTMGRISVPVTVHGTSAEFANEQICLIADAGTVVDVNASDSNEDDASSITVDLHGYYVDSY